MKTSIFVFAVVLGLIENVILAIAVAVFVVGVFMVIGIWRKVDEIERYTKPLKDSVEELSFRVERIENNEE
jgi:uncharacterized protein YoxC